MASETQPNGNTCTLNAPTVPNGYQAGDLIIAFVYAGWSDGFDTAGGIDGPDDWFVIGRDSQIRNSLPSGNGGDQVAAFYKISDGTEPANYDFTWPGDPAGFVGRIVVYRNVHQSTPLTSDGFILSSGTGSNPITLDIPYETQGAARVVFAWMSLADEAAFAPPNPTPYLIRTQNGSAPSFDIIADSGLTETDDIQVTLCVADTQVADATTSSVPASINTTSQEDDGERFVWGIAVVVNPAT